MKKFTLYCLLFNGILFLSGCDLNTNQTNKSDLVDDAQSLPLTGAEKEVAPVEPAIENMNVSMVSHADYIHISWIKVENASSYEVNMIDGDGIESASYTDTLHYSFETNGLESFTIAVSAFDSSNFLIATSPAAIITSPAIVINQHSDMAP